MTEASCLFKVFYECRFVLDSSIVLLFSLTDEYLFAMWLDCMVTFDWLINFFSLL